MQVQRISSVNNSHFKSLQNNRTTLDIDDIYAAEDRIVRHQEKMLRENNKLLADALLYSAIFSAYPNAPSFREKFFTSLEALGAKRPDRL